MAYCLNEVTLVGNLVANPEVRAFGNGEKVLDMRIATDETWTDKGTGEKRKHTDYHSISVKNQFLINLLEEHATKGKSVFVRGKLRTRKWQDRDGGDRYATEVIVSGHKGEIILN